MATKEVYWKVHTSDLFEEIVTGDASNTIFRQPLMIMKDILREIAERVIELNDPELKLLCCRLALFEIADPTSKEYDPNVFKTLEKEMKEQSQSKAPPSSEDDICDICGSTRKDHQGKERNLSAGYCTFTPTKKPSVAGGGGLGELKLGIKLKCPCGEVLDIDKMAKEHTFMESMSILIEHFKHFPNQSEAEGGEPDKSSTTEE